MNTTEPIDHTRRSTPDTSPKPLALWEQEYVDLEELPSLGAELPSPLWYGKRATHQGRVILADLFRGEAAKAERDPSSQVQRATAVDVQHFGVPEVVTPQGIQAEPPYLVWSVENGKTLRSSLLAEEDRSSRKILEIVRSVAETLAELHRYDHTVGALTPAGIWLGPAGMIQLLGLGLSRFDATTLHGAGLRYRAPEQLRSDPLSMAERLLAGTLRERADIWALGMIVLELVDQRPRLQCQDPHELLTEIQDSSLTPISTDVPWELTELLRQMLVIDVEQRNLSADELCEQIDGLLMGTALSTSFGQTVSRAKSSDLRLATSSPDNVQRQNDEAPHQDWSWRSAARNLEHRRQLFDQHPEIPLWKVWILPTLGLTVLVFLIWGLLQLVGR